MENLTAIIEAILFVSGDPVRVDVLAHAMNLTVMELEAALTELRDHLQLENRGIQLNRSGDAVFLSINPKYAPQVEGTPAPSDFEATTRTRGLSFFGLLLPTAESFAVNSAFVREHLGSWGYRTLRGRSGF